MTSATAAACYEKLAQFDAAVADMEAMPAGPGSGRPGASVRAALRQVGFGEQGRLGEARKLAEDAVSLAHRAGIAACRPIACWPWAAMRQAARQRAGSAGLQTALGLYEPWTTKPAGRCLMRWPHPGAAGRRAHRRAAGRQRAVGAAHGRADHHQPRATGWPRS